METETMGRVLTEATIESLRDLWDVERRLTPIGNPAHGGEHIFELY